MGDFPRNTQCFDFEPPSRDRESRMLDRATPTGLYVLDLLDKILSFHSIYKFRGNAFNITDSGPPILKLFEGLPLKTFP